MKIGLMAVRDGVLLLLFLILCIALPVLAEDKTAQESEVGEDKKMISSIALLKTCRPEEETKKTDSSLGMKPCTAAWKTPAPRAQSSNPRPGIKGLFNAN